jgi:tRNA(adenine34) deaminase
MCIGAIYWSQLSKIVFGAEDKKRGFQQAHLEAHPKATVYGGIMAEEATALLHDFFLNKRA